MSRETYPSFEAATEAMGGETYCCFICPEGKREIVGLDVGTSEDGAFWFQFLRSVADRGLGCVELVISDAHRGLRDAIATVFAGASWQRCRSHFMTNLLTRVPRCAQPAVAMMVRTVYQQPSADEVHG